MKNTFEQTDIFSLFDIEDEVTVKMEAAKAAAAKAHEARLAKLKGDGENTETKKPEAPKKEPFKVLVDTIIRYGQMDLPVTNYFTVEEIENGLPSKKKSNEEDGEEETGLSPISENDLRKRLEQDFPELVPNFTQLVYLEKKNLIIPILSAKKKGQNHCMETSATAEVSFSKIPFHILADFIEIAKDFSNKFGTEVMADIYFDLENQNFFMDLPRQTVTPYLCTNQETALETALKLIERRYVKIMEIHSHHVMRALPSMTDDENERSSILYAIVGRINDFFPEITVRTFNKQSQQHISLNPAKVFENPIFHDYATYLYDTSVVEVE